MAKAKEIEGLNCEGSAGDDIGLVLRARLDEMCGLGAAALDWSDPEGVHDMRVASRRLRSALRDFKPYLRHRRLKAAATELKSVAAALGAVRDADVAIMALKELQQEAPADTLAGIDELLDMRRAERETARDCLREAIADEKLATLQRDFTAALERAVRPRPPRHKKESAAAALTFRQIGREIILARLEELRALSQSLYQPFEAAALHRMRIAAKRLRYSMELFASCWSEALAAHAKEVAELQSSLGELHDCDVWIEGFSRMLRDMQKREEKDSSTVVSADETAIGANERKRSAAVWLLSHFARARMKHFSDGAARWHKWEQNGFFRELTGSLDARLPAVELSPLTLTPSEAVASDLEAREPA